MAKTAQQLAKEHARTDGGFEVERAFGKWLSNLTHALKSASAANYGGFSLSCKPDGTWFAVGRASSAEGDPVVAFGKARTPWDALRELNASMARGRWKPDGFALERGLGPDKEAIRITSEHEGDHSPGPGAVG